MGDETFAPFSTSPVIVMMNASYECGFVFFLLLLLHSTFSYPPLYEPSALCFALGGIINSEQEEEQNSRGEGEME